MTTSADVLVSTTKMPPGFDEAIEIEGQLVAKIAGSYHESIERAIRDFVDKRGRLPNGPGSVSGPSTSCSAISTTWCAS